MYCATLLLCAALLITYTQLSKIYLNPAQKVLPRSRRDELPMFVSPNPLCDSPNPLCDSPNPLCDEFLPENDPKRSRRDPRSKEARSNADMVPDKSDMIDLIWE